MLVVSGGKTSRNSGASVSACDVQPLRRVCVERRSPCRVPVWSVTFGLIFIFIFIVFEDGVRIASLGSCDDLRSTDLPF